MGRTWFWAVSLCLLSPTVQAGTEAAPEVEDASGDQWPPQAPLLLPEGDLRKVWFDNDTEAAITVHFRVGAIRPTSDVIYELSWTTPNRIGHAGESGWLGLGVRLQGGAPTAYALQGNHVQRCTTTEPAGIGKSLATNIVGDDRVDVTLALPVFGLQDDAQLTNFCAKSWLGPGTRQLDSTEQSTSTYQAGLLKYIHVGPIKLTSESPLLTDSTQSGRSGPADMTGMWLDFEQAAFNSTVRVTDLDLAALNGCQWSYQFHLSGDAGTRRESSVQVSFANGTPARFEFHDFMDLGAQRLVLQPGAPGYARLVGPAFKEAPDVADLSIYAVTQRSCSTGLHDSDSMDYYPRSFFGPAPGFAAFVALVAGVLVSRKRAGRA